MKHFKTVLLLIVLVSLLVATADCRSRKYKKKSMVLRQKETNVVNFIRLAVMRLIYGFATQVGLQEPISEALNGAFVPPGADDYGDYGLLDRDDDDDYDDY